MTSAQKLTISAHFKNLATVADFVEQAAIEAGLGDKGTYAIKMAVDEACTNIIEHAYGGEGRGQIQLSYTVKNNGLEVVICDQGTSFDPDKVPQLNTDAPLSERGRRGMGLFFIRNLVDTARYSFNTPQGNQLTLFKQKGPPL